MRSYFSLPDRIEFANCTEPARFYNYLLVTVIISLDLRTYQPIETFVSESDMSN